MNDLCLGKQEDHNKVDLSQLSQVEIEIFSYCNRRCWFCPNSYVIDRHSSNILLPDEMYDRLLCDLELIEFSGRLALMRYCEPTSYRDIFLERLAQAREKVVGAELHIKLTVISLIKITYVRCMTQGFDPYIFNVIYLKMMVSISLIYSEGSLRQLITLNSNMNFLRYLLLRCTPS